MVHHYVKKTLYLGFASFLASRAFNYVKVLNNVSNRDVDLWNRINTIDFYLNHATERTNDIHSSTTLSDQTSTMPFEKGDVVFIGLARDIGQASQSFKNKLVELSCTYHASIAIVTGVNQHEPMLLRNDSCADWHIIMQPGHVNLQKMSRVERIAFLRDFQRERIRSDFPNASVIVVVDMDLDDLSDPSRLVAEISYVKSNSHAPDVTCPLGLQHYPFLEGFYDTFATVLLPNTFVFQLPGRTRKTFMPYENPQLVISSHASFPSFDHWDLMRYIQSKASPRGELPVVSCFGGFAIYRAEAFFEPLCNYAYLSDNLMMYASQEEKLPCEHVVFHKCLRQVRNATIAIQTNLSTTWRGQKPGPRSVLPTVRIHSGLSPTNILATFIPHFENSTLAESVYMLENGAFTLRINETGQLVLEEKQQSSTRTVWTPLVNTALFQNNWYKMFLVLTKRGRIELIQQNEKPLKRNKGKCKTFDKASNPSCRITLWQSEFQGPQSDIYNLFLRDNGSLHIRTQQNITVWSLDWSR